MTVTRCIWKVLNAEVKITLKNSAEWMWSCLEANIQYPTLRVLHV